MKNLISQILVWTLIFSQASFGAGRIQGSDVKSLTEVNSVSNRLIPTDKIYDVTNLQQLSTSISSGAIGGSGGGSTNYIAASTGVSIGSWVAYQNTAQSAPVTGTGGAPTVTFATSTDSSLVGPQNFLFTKGASNLQGQGFSYPFTIDAAFQSKPLTVSFLYSVASGTYVDGDMTCWLFDVTNSQLIQPSGSTIQNVIGATAKKLEFQTNSNSTSYRLIFHVASTSALAYTLRFDQFAVSPNTTSTGGIATDWQSYTPTFQGFGTPTSVEFQYRREGPDLVVRGKFVSGTSTAVEARIGLPTGLTSADTTKIPSIQPAGGRLEFNQTSVDEEVMLIEPSVTYFTVGYKSTGFQSFAKTTGVIAAANGWVLGFTARAQIQGWGTSQVLSSDTDTRVVAASYFLSANQNPGLGGQINFDSKLYDTHSAVTTGVGSWKFTAPIPGKYRISGIALYATGASRQYLQLFKNGSSFAYTGILGPNPNDATTIAKEIDLLAGDYIDIRVTGTITIGGSGIPYNTYIDISRIPGPAQIAMSEKVYLQYTGNAGTALTANVTNIDFTTKVVDSHGAWNGTVFTAPRPGWYDVKGSLNFSASATRDYYFYINGVQKYNMNVATSAATSFIVGGSYLNAGDTLTIRSDSAGTLTNSATAHWISITSQ